MEPTRAGSRAGARRRSLHRFAGCVASGLALIAIALCPNPGAARAQALVLERRIELPAVSGRIDHMAADVDAHRLFVAALASDSLEVVDWQAGARVGRMTSLHEPQGVLFLPESHHVLVANASGGGVQAYADGRAPAVAAQASLDDADNLRGAPADSAVYVGYGRALAELDPATLAVRRRIALAGHPESFQLERDGVRIYVNVPDARHIAVVDRERGRVEATWPVEGATRNFPMALDERGHRLFVATRRPPTLRVYDTASGRQVAQLAACGDADDLYVDDARQQLYLVCGDGQVDVVKATGARYAVVDEVATAPGARTGLFVPALSRLFVAVPARPGATAEIRVYRVR